MPRAVQEMLTPLGPYASASDRIAEIGEILAVGLVRLRARQSSQIAAVSGDSSLACVASQSGGANSETENDA
jgi:hypothetical protein